VAGHTDSDGEDAANQALSEKRAQAVADYLVKAGLPGNRFTAVGYGSAQPIASNDTEEGKAQNRRIEFTVK
jgi:OOP family OmpA-OmpF porin